MQLKIYKVVYLDEKPQKTIHVVFFAPLIVEIHGQS
jgi:hypothetical protein